MTTARGSGRADDRTALDDARHGSRPAFDELYDRHSPAAWRLALVAAREPAVASGAVVHAFAHVLGPSASRDPGRPGPVGVQLLRATRTAAIDAPSHAGASSPEHARAGDRAIRSFDRLPEHWRSVLWLRDVERLDLAGGAAVLGLTEPETAKLADRALDGLHKQLAREQVRTAFPDCQPTAVRLGGYVAGTLTARDAIRVRRHLDRCEDCRGRLDEVDDLAPRLRRLVPGRPPKLAALAAEAWLARTRETSGPLGLRLPGGRPMPVWAEEALAGATAAVVALGITAALAFGARNGGGDGGPTSDRTDLALGAGDGESALGGELPGEDGLDVGQSGAGPSSAPSAAPTPPLAGGPSSDAAPTSGRPAARTSPAPAPSSTVPPGTPPTTAPPSGGVVNGVDDALEPLDLCTGVGPLDDVVGCDAAEGTNPLIGLGL